MNEDFNETNKSVPETPVSGYYYNTQPNQLYAQPKMKKEKRYGAGVVIISVILSLLCGFGGAFGALAISGRLNDGSHDVIVNTADHDGELAGDLNSSLSAIVDKTKDSVVEITTETVTAESFIGQYITEGAGSGVIFASEGSKAYIMTNNHVVSSSNSITVTTTDGTKYPATIVGTDPVTDIAVISIDASGLTAATIGDSASLKVGDAIIAIGNPLGSLGGTVTEGIVSALDREITISGQTMSLLQISAAVNPGNSGGGLFNAYGELVGIVNAKSSGSTSGTSVEGLGFAVPINTAYNVARSIIENGYVTGRPVFGIMVTEVTSADMAYQYGVPRLGVYITSVNEGSTAEKAGLLAGDYIVSIGDTAISNVAGVTDILNASEVGDVLNVQIIREERTLSIDVELMESIPTE